MPRRAEGIANCTWRVSNTGRSASSFPPNSLDMLQSDLTKFIQENLLARQCDPDRPGGSLIDSGIINSMGSSG